MLEEKKDANSGIEWGTLLADMMGVENPGQSSIRSELSTVYLNETVPLVRAVQKDWQRFVKENREGSERPSLFMGVTKEPCSSTVASMLNDETVGAKLVWESITGWRWRRARVVIDDDGCAVLVCESAIERYEGPPLPTIPEGPLPFEFAQPDPEPESKLMFGVERLRDAEQGLRAGSRPAGPAGMTTKAVVLTVIVYAAVLALIGYLLS